MKKNSFIGELITIIGVILAVFAFSVSAIEFGKNSFYTSIFVSGKSMSPTLKGDDDCSEYGLIDESPQALESLERFDIVSCYYSFSGSDYNQPYVRNSSPRASADRKIKRIIGIPGDTLHFENEIFSISYVKDGIRKTEVYNSENLPFERKTPIVNHELDSIVLQEDQYFVLGDNWSAGGSMDCMNTSTTNKHAPIYKENICGVLTKIEGTCEIHKKIVCQFCHHELEVKNNEGLKYCSHCQQTTNCNNVKEYVLKNKVKYAHPRYFK